MKILQILILGIAAMTVCLSTASAQPKQDTAEHAQFVSQLLPSTVSPGETFKALIQYRNTSQTHWKGKPYLKAISKEAKQVWGIDQAFLVETGSIAPNSIATFSLTATAPTTPGRYPFQWAFMPKPSNAATSQTPETFIEVVSPHSINNSAKADAEFIAVHVDEQMIAGEEYDVAVIFKNVGESTWWAGNTRLISQDPEENLVWFINHVEYGETSTTPPEDIHAFRFSVRAPETPGQYSFQWQLFNTTNKQTFGEVTESTTITVNKR